jgi:molybdate transport system ATP-binding protein
VSAETLSFRIRLKRGANFALDVEASVPLRGITAIVGGSGGGKTTLLRALAGLEVAQVAKVQFRGQTWDDQGIRVPPEERRIGFVFQSPSLFPHLNVAGNLAYGAKRRDVQSYEAIVDALDLSPLLSRSVEHLSGGEARRVALGRALAANPQVLFLDEPLSGLDRARKAELLPYIGRAVAEARVPALYVTHSLDEVTALADGVIGLAAGQLTGWRTPPARLLATVTSVTDGLMRVLINGAEPGQGADVSLPLIARVGEVVGLGLPPESLMISAEAPGRSDALLQVPGTVVEGKGALSLSVFGQRLSLPKGGAYAIGSTVWLSILRVLPRPEPSDSRAPKS